MAVVAGWLWAISKVRTTRAIHYWQWLQCMPRTLREFGGSHTAIEGPRTNDPTLAICLSYTLVSTAPAIAQQSDTRLADFDIDYRLGKGAYGVVHRVSVLKPDGLPHFHSEHSV